MRPALAAAGLLSVVLSGCSPPAPPGVDKAALDEAISEAIGDPGTCVLIADQNRKLLYQFGTHMVCGRKLPACDGPGDRALEQLLKTAPTSGTAQTASCRSNADGSRLVAWAAGPVEGKPMVFAAVMEGDLVPPGIVVADKLKGAFARAGLSGQ